MRKKGKSWSKITKALGYASNGGAIGAVRAFEKRLAAQQAPGAPDPPSTPAQLVSIRHRQALQYRRAGYTYAQIAAKLGYSDKASAAKAVMAALNEDMPKMVPEELRTLEDERLDALYRVAFRQARKGSLEAIDRCLKIGERRSKLHPGLDAPQPTGGGMTVNATFVNIQSMTTAELQAFINGNKRVVDVGSPG